MTYVTDPIGDLLTRIRNAQGARHTSCTAPWSRVKQQLCELLQRKEWIKNVSVEGEGWRRLLVIEFNEEKAKLELKRVSKPGRRVYVGAKEVKPVLQGFGMAVLTTSQGLMTDEEARQKNVGGELLCTIA